MTQELREILRRYGNFMSGYDGDGDEIDIDEANDQILKEIREEIEKVENPYNQDSDQDANDVNLAFGFEKCRRAVLKALESWYGHNSN